VTEFLDVDAFARAVGVKPETVRKWCRADPPKLVPYGHPPGGHRRFHPDQVAEVLGRVAPAQPAALTERGKDIEAYVLAMKAKANATAPRSKRGAGLRNE
jgi:hypothetical protein